jgi:threonine synthase
LSADVAATVKELAKSGVRRLGRRVMRVIDERPGDRGLAGTARRVRRVVRPRRRRTTIVTLQEGNTPLLHADRLSERLGADVWLKYEGLNPSGSFKDRGMTMAITKAKAKAPRR